MTKEQAINELNDMIDKLIIQGKFGKEYKRLCQIHKKITQEK